MFRNVMFAVSVLLFSQVASAEKPLAPPSIEGAITVSAEQLVDMIVNDETLVVVDARKNTEFAKGHIEGAVFLLDTEMTEEKLAAAVASKSTPVAFYCNGPRCMRSSNSAKMALSWGYDKVYWFRGGWKEWVDQEMPIAR